LNFHSLLGLRFLKIERSNAAGNRMFFIGIADGERCRRRQRNLATPSMGYMLLIFSFRNVPKHDDAKNPAAAAAAAAAKPVAGNSSRKSQPPVAGASAEAAEKKLILPFCHLS
jgi:hypothetical protein